MGRKLVWWTSLTFLALAATQAGAQKRYEPPLRLGVPFPAAWKTMLEVLDREEWTLVKQDRGRGEILTGYRDYMSGPLTAGHLDKIGVRPRLPDGEWVRVRYRYDLSGQPDPGASDHGHRRQRHPGTQARFSGP